MANIITELHLEMSANWYVSKKLNSVGRVGENTVTKLIIEPTEILDNVTYEIEIADASGSKNVAELTIDGSELYLILTANMLSVSGITKMQVRGLFTDGSIKKSNIFELKVNRSISATEHYEEYAVTIFDQLVAECRDITEGAESYAVRAETAAVNAEAYEQSASASAEAASTSATSATSSATVASNSATSASTSAVNAATSETNAAASATAASTSAANANTSATNAANSATSAATSATNAHTSEVNASTSETNASTSAAEAEASAESIAASVSQINENTYRINDLEAIIGGYQLTDLPTGAVANITDGTALLMPSLKVGIEPVQDLHGYDHPWAGGAGKNLYNPDDDYSSVGKMWNSSSGILVDSSTHYGSPKIHVSPETIYTRNNGAQANIYFDTDGNYLSTGYEDKTFTTPSGCYYVAFNIPVNVDHKTIQLEAGSTATSYEPYSNICPISGWTAANVTRCGKNLADDTINGHYLDTDGTVKDAATYRCTDYVDITGLTKLKTTISTDYPLMWVWRIASYDANKSFIELSLNSTISAGTFEREVTLPVNAKYIRACALVRSTDWTIYDKDKMHTYTIQFKDGDNPLTVYGGTLDVTTGALTVTDVFIASYNGETLPSTWISDRDVYAEGATPTTGAEVVYKLANSVTYHLTPTQVRTLVGNNNIWADTGDIIEGKYFKSLT